MSSVAVSDPDRPAIATIARVRLAAGGEAWLR